MKKAKLSEMGWLTLIITLFIVIMPTSAEESVGLYNSTLKQIITSSTLKWTSFKKEDVQYYVAGAESDLGPIFLCRILREGEFILGQLKPDYTSCVSSGNKNVNEFEVLENIENASLIYWKPWWKLDLKPSGAVLLGNSLDNVFIGRTKSDSTLSHNIGRIAYESSTGQLITYNAENNEILEKIGEILVEIVPVAYELNNVILDLDKQHIKQHDPIISYERLLKNDGDEAATDATVIEYNYNYSLSWGHGHGIAIGLNTVITMADGTKYPPIAWANPFKENRTGSYKLERYLEPGTACNVTFTGNYTARDVIYTGKLTTFYKEHDPRSRQISGERIENTMEVDAVYGEIYYLSNNSLVPTTTTTTTTTTSTTTTTTTTTLPPPLPDENEISIREPNKSGEKDSSNMMGDSSENMANMSSESENSINKATVGGLGSNPNKANTRIITITVFCLPMFALLL